MKKLLTKILIAIIIAQNFFILIPKNYANASIDGYLNITSPNGGENFTTGDTVTITWDSSDNINMITIGYSYAPGHLDWIAYNIPNNGSYTWKIDFDYTSSKDIELEIIGYEVGAGSLSDRTDGSFTVSPKITIPEPEPIVEPEPTIEPEEIEEEEMEPVITEPEITTPEPANPTPVVIDADITIIDIEINQWFYFEGSNTTNLSMIENPECVSNFTLDRQELSMITFLKDIDMSTDTAENAIQDLDNNVGFEYMFF